MVAGILGICEPVRVLASERTRLAREQMRVAGFMVGGCGCVCCSFMMNIWQKDEIDSLVTGQVHVAVFVEVDDVAPRYCLMDGCGSRAE